MAAVVCLAYRDLFQHILRVKAPCAGYLVDPFRPERAFGVDQYHAATKAAFFWRLLGSHAKGVAYLRLAASKLSVKLGNSLSLYASEQELVEGFCARAAAQQRLSLFEFNVSRGEFVVKNSALPQQFLRCHDKGGSGFL